MEINEWRALMHESLTLVISMPLPQSPAGDKLLLFPTSIGHRVLGTEPMSRARVQERIIQEHSEGSHESTLIVYA